METGGNKIFRAGAVPAPPTTFFEAPEQHFLGQRFGRRTGLLTGDSAVAMVVLMLGLSLGR